MKIFAILIISILVSSSISISDISKWNDISEINKSSQSEKIRMIYFTADWCKWCKKMEKDVFSDNEIQDYVNNYFLPFIADIDARNRILYQSEYFTVKELSELLNVKSYPTILFMNSSLESIGELAGYHDKENFMKVLKYVNQDISSE